MNKLSDLDAAAKNKGGMTDEMLVLPPINAKRTVNRDMMFRDDLLPEDGKKSGLELDLISGSLSEINA